MADTTGKYKSMIDQRMKKLGKEDQVSHSLKQGEPLPNNGSCKHQKKS